MEMSNKRESLAGSYASGMDFDEPLHVSIATGSSPAHVFSIGKTELQEDANPSLITSATFNIDAQTLPSVPSTKSKKQKPNKKAKKWTWKKDPTKPKRPLSAYNLFFSSERSRIVEEEETDAREIAACISSKDNFSAVFSEEGEPMKRKHRKTHGKISFQDLARTIAARWKSLEDDARAPFLEAAATEKARYDREMEMWKLKQEISERKERQRQLEAIIAKSKQDKSKDNNQGSGVFNKDLPLPTYEGTTYEQAQPSYPDHAVNWEGLTPPPPGSQAFSQQSQAVSIGNVSVPSTSLSLTSTYGLPRSDSLDFLSHFDDDIGFGDDELVAMPSSMSTTADGSATDAVATAYAFMLSQAAAAKRMGKSEPSFHHAGSLDLVGNFMRGPAA